MGSSKKYNKVEGEETLNAENIEVEGEETLNAENIDGDYPIKEIKINKDRISIFDIKRKLDNPERGKIILHPDFQRNDDRWKPRQKSELIESILMGIPIPVIYMIQGERISPNDEPKRQVIDGLQRLSCIKNFLDNKFALTNLKIMPNINSKKFLDLEPAMQNRIEDYQIEIYTILPPVPERVKLDIFNRINRGGTILNNQEMRNAMYSGTSTKIINKMSELDSFKNLFKNKINTTAMKDKYLILRFFAFYLLKTGRLYPIEYKNSIDDFLAEAMQFINKNREEDYNDVVTNFNKAMQNILDKYDDTIFRFENKEQENRKRPINMALFECITYLFVRAIQDNIKLDIKKIKLLKKDKFDDPSKFTFGVDSVANVNFRFDEVEKLLKEIDAK